MKQFDIEKAKQGHPVCTRDGRRVRILSFDVKCREPLVVAIQENDGDREEVYTYALDGIFLGNNNLSEDDLMMASVKHEGWVNVYKSNDSHEDLDSFALYQMQQGIFETKDEALGAVKKSIKYSTYIATVKIKWEE